MLMRIGMFAANVPRKDRINPIIVNLDAYASIGTLAKVQLLTHFYDTVVGVLLH